MELSRECTKQVIVFGFECDMTYPYQFFF